MAITKRPATTQVERDQVDVDALINKGGSVAQADPAAKTKQADEPEKTVVVNLRIPTSMLTEIDEILSTKKVRSSRHVWLLEAVWDKVEREKRELEEKPE
jgi:hypothetical protein